MLRLEAEAITLELDGRGASEVRLSGRDRRGQAETSGSQCRSSGSIGSLALF